MPSTVQQVKPMKVQWAWRISYMKEDIGLCSSGMIHSFLDQGSQQTWQDLGSVWIGRKNMISEM